MFGNELMAAMVRGYSAVNPRDLRDTEVHMSEATFRNLFHASGMAGEPSARGDGSTMFGLTVRIDDTMALDDVQYVTENEHDRALRRLARDGVAVNVMRPVFRMDASTVVMQDPTLRALLAKWCRKIFK